MIASAAVLTLSAGAVWWTIQRTRKEFPSGWFRYSFPRFVSNPFCLFGIWAALHSVAYFAVLQVPSIYPWYQIYVTAAILALLGFAPVWLAEQGEHRFIGMLRERNISWKNLTFILLAAVVVCWAGFASFEHFTNHLPRNNPARYRYAGYRAAAEWVNANAEASDIIRVGEIGVFGWYCPL